MAELTGGAPKELLPLGSRSVLWRVLDEAAAAEPDEIVLVSSPTKPQLQIAAGAWWEASHKKVPIRIACQESMTGAAPALAAANVESDALILFADCVYSPSSPLERLAALVHRGIDILVSVEQVQESQVGKYGIVEVDEATGSIRTILEKPSPIDTASRWAVAARYAFSGPVMGLLNDYCRHQEAVKRPEMGITEIINLAIAQGIDARAVPVTPAQQRMDCGSPHGYTEALRKIWE